MKCCDDPLCPVNRHEQDFQLLHAAYLNRRLQQERERFCGTQREPNPGAMRAFIHAETELFIEMHAEHIGGPEEEPAQ